MSAPELTKTGLRLMEGGASMATPGKIIPGELTVPRGKLFDGIKRVVDIVFSLAIIIVFSWLYLLIALLIKIDDPKGPVFFKQKRVTKGGREFEMYKFRSMVVDAEAQLEKLMAENEKTGPVFKMKNDPRVTRIGKILRKTSLDELPQFFNVLKGDISTVGPRPALPSEVQQYGPKERNRLLVPGGVTCLWQTRMNRDAITFDEWMDMDLTYIRKRGPWTDTKIVVQTIGMVLMAQGR